MEIVHIVLGKANPQRMNGVNKVVYQLATQQAAAGIPVSVWGITSSLDHNYGERNFETRLFKASRNPFKIAPQLRAELQQRRGTIVVHVHGGWVPVFATLANVLHGLSIPFVLTPHGAYNTVAMERSWLKKKIYYWLFERHLIRHASKIHCIGASEVAGLKKLSREQAGKAFLLPYGFDAPPLERQKKRIHPNEFVIGFVGRIDIHTKGLDLLIDAMSGYHGCFSKTAVWIIGDGSDRNDLERMIVERQLNLSVIVMGGKFGEEKNELIRQMDAFVHPSRNEGLPTAVLEAAAFGVPCIVSKATNVGQYVRPYEAGIVINNEDALELRQAMEELCQLKKQGKLSAMGDNAARMVSEVFAWPQIIGKISGLYEQ